VSVKHPRRMGEGYHDRINPKAKMVEGDYMGKGYGAKRVDGERRSL